MLILSDVAAPHKNVQVSGDKSRRLSQNIKTYALNILILM